jgi:hypothetical protein
MSFYDLTIVVPCSGLGLPTSAPIRLANQKDLIIDNDVPVVSVDVIFEISLECSGIGSYEFWGMKGYDKGETYFEINSWTFAKKDWMTKNFVDFVSDFIGGYIDYFEDFINRNPPETFEMPY